MSECPSRPVIVTRPLAQAGPLAERIRAVGRHAVIFPLLEINPLPDDHALVQTLGRLADYALVAFVSPNAIDAVFRLLPSWPEGVPIAVMGEGSKSALERHGVTQSCATILSPRNPQRTDSSTLLEVLDTERLQGRRVLVLRGESGRELLADALRQKGVHVDQVATYRREMPTLDDQARMQLTRLLAADAQWIITSSEALRFLVEMVRETQGSIGVAKLQHQQLIVPHVRIVETAQLLGFHRILPTGSGDEHLIAALQFQL